MKTEMRFFVCALAVLLGANCGPSYADWAESKEPLVIRPAPARLGDQPQNPPSFTWARYPVYPKPAGYVLEVTSSTGVISRYNAPRNFYLPSKAFADGTYSWRVRPNNNYDWSSPRNFTISSRSLKFEVPENSDLKLTVQKHGRSRQLPPTFMPYAYWTDQMKANRSAALKALTTDVTNGLLLPTVSDTMWPQISTLQGTALSTAIYNTRVSVYATTHQLEAAALLYRITGDSRYLQEAKKRGDELVALDPNGNTGYQNSDSVHRAITLSLAKAIDYLWNSLALEQRTRWQAMVIQRADTIYTDLSSYDGRMDEYPYDSHGAVALGYLALISTLVLDDNVPAANAWFDFSVRAYYNAVFVWSGAEGGYAPGTPYGLYEAAASLQVWGPLKEATGVNLYDKPWAIGFSRMFAHFLPPGTPGFVFGDQHELKIDFSVLKSFTSRVQTPDAAWYSNQLTGGEDPLIQLASEYPLPASKVAAPAPPPNSALYPSIGWVAMHSDIKNPLRTSVYFKSSPYGSYNHSHGDQNTLVVDSGGRRLLSEAGYQDYYYSPLSVDWYRQTKAHNGITYDGGIGQATVGKDNIIRNGSITAFATTTALDYAEGDATPAYAGQLTSAIRKVWYLRNSNAVVVLDKLVSPTARKFEWNLHAPTAIAMESSKAVKITNIDSTLCISSLPADAEQFVRITAPANPYSKTEDHGAFVKTAASTSAEFLVVLDVGCKRPTISLTTTATGRSLTVGQQTLVLPK